MFLYSYFLLTYISWGLITYMYQEWTIVSQVNRVCFPPLLPIISSWDVGSWEPEYQFWKSPKLLVAFCSITSFEELLSHVVRMTTVLSDSESAFQAGRNKKQKESLCASWVYQYLIRNTTFFFSRSFTLETSVYILNGQTSSQETWNIEYFKLN